MIPYSIYKLVHFAGIFVSLMALTAACAHMLRGGTSASNPQRRLIAAAHGTAVFLVLLGGFGMLARLDIVQGGLPVWIYVKLGIWTVVTLALTLAYRGASAARVMLIGVPALAVTAAAVALYKPFAP